MSSKKVFSNYWPARTLPFCLLILVAVTTLNSGQLLGQQSATDEQVKRTPEPDIDRGASENRFVSPDRFLVQKPTVATEPPLTDTVNSIKSSPHPAAKYFEPTSPETNQLSVSATGSSQVQFVLSDDTLSDMDAGGIAAPIASVSRNATSNHRAGPHRVHARQEGGGTAVKKTQELIAQLTSPLPPQPLQKLYIYPTKQFPKRESRTLYGQSEDADPWILQNDFATNTPIVGFTQIRDTDFNPWYQKYSAWTSPNFHCSPLYFEQINLERYGIGSPHFAHARSAAHFFVSIPLLPYKIAANRRCDCAYTLGHYRPGSCPPAYRHFMPINSRGVTAQTLAILALVAIVP